MKHFKILCTLFLALLFILPQTGFAEDEFEGEDLSRLLEVREDDRYLVYGEYVEVEVTATESVDLEFANEVVPFGMEVEKLADKSFVIFGRSEFVGKLCFLLNATKLNGNISTERLCLYSEENEELNYPKFSGERFLETVEANNSFNISFDIEDHDVDFFQNLITPLSASLNISRDSKGVMSVSGKINQAGMHEFVVKTTESESDIVVYKQFVIEVTEQNNSYQCAPGYYWDDYLRYCVQANGRTCSTGTWYDQSSNTCRAYRSVQSCRSGSYWDHWLSRCIRPTAMRCPLNYEWDGYYNRCVRLPYTCSYNERYNYNQRRCVPLYRSRVCSVGSRYDSYRQRCVSRARLCRNGNYWNGSSCVRTRRVCRSGRYYDPVRGRCLTRNTVRTCRPGSFWDHISGSCSRRPVVVNRTCRAGTRWSRGSGRCITHSPRRTVRHPERRHRPVVTRPNRPTRPGTTRPDRPTRPSRPTTRPDRPTRPGTTRPSTPTRPSRPTTRPDRPTTRPSTPTRPSRPTTRPDRPTTRPSTPTRPSRPTTRPDRPSRPSSPSRPCTGRRCRGN